MGVRDEKTVTLVSSGETECFLLKQGLSLARGECSNCRVNEVSFSQSGSKSAWLTELILVQTQAKFWWTDPVVKSELGLDRRLCHACGIYVSIFLANVRRNHILNPMSDVEISQLGRPSEHRQ